MKRIGHISFVPLEGETPEHLGLEPLPPSIVVGEVIRDAFAPFATDGAFESITDFRQLGKFRNDGLHLVYLYGHAWLGPSGPEVAVRADGSTEILRADELLKALFGAAGTDHTMLVLDCCHAEAFDKFIAGLPQPPRLCVYGAGAEEKAIALHGDRTSRLSLVLAAVLSGRAQSVDLTRVIVEAADRLDADGVLRGQTVSYRMHGLAIRLQRGQRAGERKRERTVALIRNIFLGSGAMAALILVLTAWFYWSHTLVEIDLADLDRIADDLRIVASQEDPGNNASKVFARRAGISRRARLWVPAGNIILRINANYADGEERALGFHLKLAPGFDPLPKFLTLAVPSATEVEARPGMAFVPLTDWIQGRELKPRSNASPYWIDIRPPTVNDYMPVARALLDAGRLDIANSFILNGKKAKGALENLGLGQLKTLNDDLGDIFGVIDAANSPHVSAPSDIVVGLVDTPCPACPAPMTRYEAKLFCVSQGKRLPTDVEWELAARGVDGRVFPWGDRFDESRANVPGLPDKGEPSPDLKPVEAYRDHPSPFGLIDTVGNAGDWVVNTLGSYERVYMGATYRYNPEDATTFRMLPVTDSDYLVREITVRCAVDGGHSAKRDMN
jgi:hypothetical protein